ARVQDRRRPAGGDRRRHALGPAPRWGALAAIADRAAAPAGAVLGLGPDAQRAPARAGPRVLLRPPPPRVVRAHVRARDVPVAPLEDDGDGPLHASPVLGLQPAAADRPAGLTHA